MNVAEKCEVCGSGTTGMNGEPKWCCYCGAKLTGTPLDPVLRVYDTVPTTGWAVKTPEQFLAVLSQLHRHLAKQNDAEGSQLLARVWRQNNPVLKALADTQALNPKPWLASHEKPLADMIAGHIKAWKVALMRARADQPNTEQGDADSCYYQHELNALAGIEGVVEYLTKTKERK